LQHGVIIQDGIATSYIFEKDIPGLKITIWETKAKSSAYANNILMNII
jgi:hypothetical protein